MKERRNRWLFVLLLVLNLMTLAGRSPAGDGERSLLGSLGLRLVAPLGWAIEAATRATGEAALRLRTHGAVVADNERLRGEAERQRVELMRLRELEEEVRRLARAVDYARTGSGEFRFAEVVYVDHASWMRSLILRAPGSTPRIDQAVVAPEGVVGRVIRVSGSYAKVLLLTDRASSIGVMLEGSRRQGILHGDGTGALAVNFIPTSTPVAEGERVLTAGIDGVFPAGLPVGTVTSVEAGDDLFRRIRVQPAADLAHLGAVFLLDAPPPVRFPDGPDSAGANARP